MLFVAFTDDFQASSKELEEELERELASTESVQADLRAKIVRLESEKEDWKVRTSLCSGINCPFTLLEADDLFLPLLIISSARESTSLPRSRTIWLSDRSRGS